MQDVHCHLDLYPDFKEQVRRREVSKIRTLTVTTTPRAWPRNRELTQGATYVHSALGLHPELVGQYADELTLWKKYLKEAEYIGEVGVDGRRENRATIPVQKEIFEHILRLSSQAKKKAISIHSAGAVRTALECIEKNCDGGNTSLILHWFTGSLKEVVWAVELGCFFSVNYRMAKTQKWSALCKNIPIGRMLIETDAPFFEKKYVGKEIELSCQTAKFLKDIYRMDVQSMGEVLERNVDIALGGSIKNNAVI